MSKILKCNYVSFDVEKSYYDLALAYARTKLDRAIQDEKFRSDIAPVSIQEMEYFAEEFYSAIGFFANTTEEYIKSLVDPA